MKLGEFGIGAGVTKQGMEPMHPAEYDRVEIILDESGLDKLLGDLVWLTSGRGEFREASEPLARHDGLPCSLRITVDPKLERF